MGTSGSVVVVLGISFSFSSSSSWIMAGLAGGGATGGLAKGFGLAGGGASALGLRGSRAASGTAVDDGS